MPIEPESFPPKLPPPSDVSRPLTRRRLLRLLGLAGVGIASIPVAEALIPFVSRLQQQLRSRNLSVASRSFPLMDVDNYAAFLKSRNFRRVTVSKIMASHAKERNGIRNMLPPRKLWTNLIPTLTVAEMIAQRLEEEVLRVVSAYRTPAYNAMCPGSAKNSQHLQNNALDLVFKSSPKKVAEVARELRSLGKFRGGVGVYASFIHIDTRGHNSDW